MGSCVRQNTKICCEDRQMFSSSISRCFLISLNALYLRKVNWETLLLLPNPNTPYRKFTKSGQFLSISCNFERGLFTMIIYEKIYLEKYINSHRISLKNNFAELNFWWLVRVTLMVAWWLFVQNLGRWWGPMNCYFAQKGMQLQWWWHVRWWGHSTITRW